ncbi:MAG: SDR family oxidoreductase [Nitrososphaerota archaeon]|nr:SDR family oxidoreductase [Nitrososphaerota archaeon]
MPALVGEAGPQEIAAALGDLALFAAGVAIESADTAMIAKQTVAVDAARARQNLRLVEHLEDLEDVQRFLGWFASNHGTVDILVSNASRDSRYSVLDIPFEEWKRMVQLNMTSPFLLCQGVAKKMVADHVRGKIILIGAIQALFPLQDSFAYVSTKGGVISMMKSMASDLGKFGIQVLSVLPGPIYIKEGDVPASLDQRAAPLLGRMGRREEVAKAIAFLASDDNSFITGSYVIVDGGRLISRKGDPTEISSVP